jgi:hypothetical protein
VTACISLCPASVRQLVPCRASQGGQGAQFKRGGVLCRGLGRDHMPCRSTPVDRPRLGIQGDAMP